MQYSLMNVGWHRRGETNLGEGVPDGVGVGAPRPEGGRRARALDFLLQSIRPDPSKGEGVSELTSLTS